MKTPKDMPELPPGFPAVIAMPSDEQRAIVRIVDGQVVLDDPVARGVIAAVDAHNRGIAKQNCAKTLELNSNRVQHFKNRMSELNQNKEDTLIVIINVDDVHGRDIAEILMPGAEKSGMWQNFRNQGQTPFARGLAGRAGIQKCLDLIDLEAADKLLGLSGIAVVVVDHGTADVYEA